MLIEDVTIDRINLRIDKVTFEEYERFIQRINFYRHDIENLNSQRVATIGADEQLFHECVLEKLGISDYRYNHYLMSNDDTTDGNVFIGYRHNSSKPSNTYSIKIEFNPSKPTHQQNALLKAMNDKFSEKVVRLIECDVAIDVPYPINDIYSCNTKGKTMATVDTTRYFGKKHTDKYLKIYDKLKEQKIDVSNKGSEHLTRIEFTFKPNGNDGMTYQQMLRYSCDLNNNYRIGLMSGIEDFRIKCVAIAFSNNHIKFSEIPPYEKIKLKEHLGKSTNKLDMNKVIKKRWKDLMESVSQWFMWSANYTDNYALFGSEERDLSEDEQLLFEEFMEFNNKKILQQSAN